MSDLADLLRSVLARPNDHDTLRVYADALIERGDPRGELVVVQLERLAADSDELVEREKQLALALSLELSRTLHQKLRAHWNLGFLYSLDLTPSDSGTPLAETFRELGALPEARRLRRLVLRCVEPGWGSLLPAIGALVHVVPQLKSFSELSIMAQGLEGERPRLYPIGDLSQLCAACPKLELLELVCVEAVFRHLSVPALRVLRLEDVSPYQITQLASVRLPALEELYLACSNANIITQMENLLARSFPRLGVLSIDTSHIASQIALARMVPQSNLMLRRFSLIGRELDDDAVAALLAHAAWLSKLERVTVEVSPENHERLDRALGNVAVYQSRWR